MRKPERVVVAMSGGVDSSVATWLLKEQGYDVIGVTMRLWSLEDSDAMPGQKSCCSVEDIDDARRVCQIAGVPHYVVNFEREFRTHVVDYFCDEYRRGRTPHPCIACNDRLKFNFLLQRAQFMEADYVATGHYARIVKKGDRWRLFKGIDVLKDQSYVLFNLRQRDMDKILFPIGGLSKDNIRAIAAEAKLPVANKPDSQDICFIPGGDYRAFLKEQVGCSTPGDIVDEQGQVLGNHPGIEHFTVGQRRGLGLATGEKLFVLGVDAARAQVVVGPENSLCHNQVWASKVNYVSGKQPSQPTQITARIRYRGSDTQATLEPRGDTALLMLEKPQRAITPGQAVVFYQGDEVIGGGFIDNPPQPASIPVNYANTGAALRDSSTPTQG